MSEPAEKPAEKPEEKQEKSEKPIKQEESAEKTETKKAVKKKIKRSVPSGYVHITAGFNNTILTATDPSGGVLARSSAGASGFKGTKKSTPYAAQVAAERLAEKTQQFGLKTIQVFLNGIGPGREQGIRGLAKSFDIALIVDRTAVPHNGCRPPKRRRV